LKLRLLALVLGQKLLALKTPKLIRCLSKHFRQCPVKLILCRHSMRQAFLQS
jgi:hypothetical protein